MKINILDGATNEPHEIEISEYDRVERIISLIDGECNSNLIYKNIILNANNLIKFYQISPGDEIWMGRIYKYLKKYVCIENYFLFILLISVVITMMTSLLRYLWQDLWVNLFI